MRSTVERVLLCAAILIVGASVALAQGTVAPPPSSGTGAASAGGASGDPGLDMPLKPPATAPEPPDPETPPEPPKPPQPPEAPPTIYGEEIESENDTIFYVLDISGSMGWDSRSYTKPDGTRGYGTRLDRAKAELIKSIMGLSENFRFNIIAYDCSTRQWANGMQEANDANKKKAISWINSLQDTGATGTGPAVAKALSDKDNMCVVLLTDGAPNCGANGLSGHRSMIRSANTQGAVINVFGIAASGSYKRFCQNVAADSGGTYVDVN